MVTATALIAATSLAAKALGSGVSGPALPALQISAGRFLFGFAVLCPCLALRWPGTTDLPLVLHGGRVLCGWSGGAFLFAASSRLPLGDANAISFLAPVVTMGLSMLLLGERVTAARWSAATVSLVGATAIAAPGTSAFQPAAGLALASALLVGAELVFIKHLTITEPPIRILAMSNGVGVALAVPVALTVWRPPSAAQWAMMAGLGVAMVSAQVLFIQANRRSDASFLAPIFYTASAFAAVYDFAFFGQLLGANSIVGIVLITTGAALLAWRGAGRPQSMPAPPHGPQRAGAR
jgi:drug/metabolite transporter (DMT)-like permease